MQKKYAIIVAGGSGSRMNSTMPKQFLPLAGRPILMHTLETFQRSNSTPEIVLVLSPSMMQHWYALCRQYACQIPHRVVAGGHSRFQSVRNGLSAVFESSGDDLDNCYIAIHDAARPLLTPSFVDLCFAETQHLQATVLATRSTSSIRFGSASNSESEERERVWMVQTPQTFKASLLREAFLQEECSSFTDDASVVEKLGYPVHIIEGDYRNIKITFPEDIEIAQVYLDSLHRNAMQPPE